MKFSSSAKTFTAAAIVFFLQIANAETMKSDVFGWEYELDCGAPVITTHDEIITTAEAYNQTVGIELVNGTMMMIDMMQNKQVATFGGDLDTWARSNYPGDDIINDTVFIEKIKNTMTGHLDNVRAGMPLEQSLAVQPASGTCGADPGLGSVDKRDGVICACPIFPISCLIFKCKGICLLVYCSHKQ